MFGRLFDQRWRLISAGERARRLHEAWLTRALSSPSRAWPVIPVRRVSDGGFNRLMSGASGRAWAERWWESTLGQLEEGEGG